MLAKMKIVDNMNMLAGSSKNRNLQLMKGDMLSFQALQVSTFKHCRLFFLSDFKAQLEGLMDVFSFYTHVILVCMYLRSVSLLRVAKTLMITGSVSHTGRSRLSMTSMSIKPNSLAFTADAEAVLYEYLLLIELVLHRKKKKYV